MKMMPFKIKTEKIGDMYPSIEMIDEESAEQAMKEWTRKHFDANKVNITINTVADEGSSNASAIKSTGLFNKPVFFKIEVVSK